MRKIGVRFLIGLFSVFLLSCDMFEQLKDKDPTNVNVSIRTPTGTPENYDLTSEDIAVCNVELVHSSGMLKNYRDISPFAFIEEDDVSSGWYRVIAYGFDVSGNRQLAYGTTLAQASEENTTTITVQLEWDIEPASADTYTVTFETNGGSAVASQTVEDGKKIDPPTAPTKADCIFNGWYTDAACTTAYNFEKLVLADLTLYAKWERDETYEGDEFYVSASGNNTTGTGERDNPFYTIAHAVDVINARSDATKDYAIYVIGTLTGYQAVNYVCANSLLIAGASGTTGVLDGQKTNGTVLSINSSAAPVTIKNLRITGGNASDNGGGIRIVDTTATLGAGVVITGNTASGNGGGVWNSKSTLTVSGATISANTAGTHGGGIYNCSDATLVVSSATISDNTATQYGGGVYSANVFTLQGGTIKGNSAVSGAGVNAAGNGTFTMTGGSVSGNIASSDGAGVYVLSGTMTMSGGTIGGNSASGAGGGVYSAGTLTMSGGTVSGNTAAGEGGGVYNSGTLFMYGTAVIGSATKTTTATSSSYSNKASGGGGIKSTGTVYLGYSDASTPAELTGGIFYNYSDGISLTNGTLIMNSGSISYSYGRGVYVGSNDYSKYGNFTMNGGTISENTTTSEGGGVYVGYHGKITMNGGSISGNSAEKGGGVSIANSLSSFTMTGGIISGNSAAENGGGVYVGNNTFILRGGTISGNTAKGGGGIYVNKPKDGDAAPVFTMYGGEISGNKATSVLQDGAAKGGNGGGVNVQTGAKATITGGSISNNAATGSTLSDGSQSGGNGGGIFSKGTFVLGGGSTTVVAVAGNTSTSAGGAIFVSGGTFAVESNATISGNASLRSGGALFMNGGSVVTINAGTISANTATNGGGAITVGDESTLKVYGGTIVGNTSQNDTYSNGIFVSNTAATFIVGKAASIDIDDGVRLSPKAVITIDSALTSSSVATIRPSTYTIGHQVLDGTSSLLSANYGKFSLVQPSAENIWRITSEGKLRKTDTDTYTPSDYDTVAELASAIKDATGDITVSIDTATYKDNLDDIADAVRQTNASVSLDLSNVDGNTTVLAGFFDTFHQNFSNCTSLVSITLPSGVERIDTNAFTGCTNLTTVVIPSSVWSIGSNAFSGCNSLTSVVFEDTTYKWATDMSNTFSVSDPAANAERLKNSNSNFVRLR